MSNQKFKLAVVRPVKGQPGQLMMTVDKVAETVSQAVREVRAEAHKDFIVLQKADYDYSVNKWVSEQMDKLHQEEKADKSVDAADYKVAA